MFISIQRNCQTFHLGGQKHLTACMSAKFPIKEKRPKITFKYGCLALPYFTMLPWLNIFSAFWILQQAKMYT
jgi:hypothetical protein